AEKGPAHTHVRSTTLTPASGGAATADRSAAAAPPPARTRRDSLPVARRVPVRNTTRGGCTSTLDADRVRRARSGLAPLRRARHPPHDLRQQAGPGAGRLRAHPGAASG